MNNKLTTFISVSIIVAVILSAATTNTAFSQIANNSNNGKSQEDILNELLFKSGGGMKGTKWAETFAADPTYKDITVIYESPTLLVLESDFGGILWKAVDQVMTDGYTISQVTPENVVIMTK